jgi:hypothetical protein
MLLLIGIWVLMLRLHGAYDRRLLGHGPEEYKSSPPPCSGSSLWWRLLAI